MIPIALNFDTAALVSDSLGPLADLGDSHQRESLVTVTRENPW